MLSQNSLNSELYKIINMSDEIIKKNDVINTLLQYGANINHQYTEHNLNTPLHFAVLKHDKDTTKHLLDKNASKEIYNQDKETAENIAKRMKYQDIMALFNLNGTPPEKKNLMSQSSDAFFYSSHKNLIELEYREPFSLNKTGTEIRMHKFKILKINKCPNVAAAAEILKGDDFSKLLNDSTHLFYVIIQMIILPSPCDKTICEIEPKNVKRSFMLQLDCVSSHSNFSFAYKDCAFTHFDTKTHPTIELFKFNNSLELNKNTDKIINDSQYVSSILRENWWLYLRILMLGAENLPMFKNNGVQILEEAAEFGSPEILAALLDLQVDINHGIQIVPQKSYELLDKTNDDGMTPLMIAASKGKCKSFKFLIKCGADLYYQKRIGKNQNKSVSDFAFENGRYDNLKAICENDGYIPDVPEHDISDKFLLDYIRDMEKFHDALRNGDIDVVKLFVDKYPFIRRAYNRQKQSAAETLEEADKKSSPSICDKLSTIGVFLREKGFIFNCESARQQRIGEENVRNVGFKYSTKNINSHIYYLLSKTHFATESQTTHANLSKILQYYKDLNLHIQQLMEVIAMHADLCIVIDMENPSTIRMDQTSSFDTSGCTYNRLGRICIGAAINIDNAQSEQHVVGTIAHEFTHLAMEMLFENDCKPYKKENNKKQVEFKHVVTKIYAKYLEYRFDTSIPDDLDVIIKRVFSCYPPDVWHAELIVRIPEMTAYYSNIPNGVNELSKFYETINIVDFKEFLSNQATYKMRASNEKLNKSLSHLHEVNSLNIQLLKVCSWNWIQGSSFFRAIMSDLPFLSACHILQHFLEHDNLEDIKKEKIFLTIDKIDLFSEELINAHDHYNAMLIVDCSNENPTNILEFKNFVSKLGSSRRIIILTSHTSVLLSNYMEHEKYKINYVWKDLRPDTQTALLRNRITFQGMQVLLSEIWQAIPEAISHIDLAKLINFKAIEIGSKIPPSKGYDKRYYIERSFKNILNFEKLMEFANNKKIVIISNKPGMGKSTILSHLASTIQNPKINGNSNSLMWIVKINVMDLKDMLEFNNQPTEDILLPLTDPTFKSFYEKSMVTLMLDGFDEVNEACQKNLITLLNKIKEKCKQIWISTRPQFCDMLKEKLFIDDGNILNLEQFSEEDQIEFFKKFYLKEKENLRKKRNIQNEETSQEEDLKKFNETLIVNGLKGFMGNPLHVQMLSMIFVQHDNSNDAISGIISNQFNIAWLYSKFIKTKLDIFVRDKESFGEESSDVYEYYLLDHRLLAMAEITGSNMYNDGVFLPKKTLLDIGLVYLDSNDQKIKFIHRTYAEYLAAKYFVHQLFDNHVDLSDTWNGPEIDLEFDSDLMVEFIDELCKGNENNLPKMNIFGDKLIKRKENIEHLIRLIVFCLKNKLMHLFVLIFESLKSRKEIVTQDYLQLFSRTTADLLMLTCYSNEFTGKFRWLAVFFTFYMSYVSDMQTDKDVVRSILAENFYFSGPNLPSHLHNPLCMSFGNCRFNEFESIWKIYESNFPDKNEFFNCLLSSCRQYSSILFGSKFWLKNESLQNLFKVIKIFCDTFGEKMVELFSVRDGKGNSFLHALAENWNGGLFGFNRLNECEAFELPEIFYDCQPLDSIFVNPNDINSNLKLLEIAASCGTLKMFEACCRNLNANLTTSLTSLTTSLSSLTYIHSRLSKFDSKNLFMAAIRNRNQLVIERVAEIYIENSINNSINFDTHLIKRTTESGKTILHIASEIHIDMYSIWGTIKKCFKEKEELKKLAVNFPLKSCENFLITYIKTHFKADNFDEMFEKLWVILKNDLHTDQIKTLLTETRKYYAYDGTRLTFIDKKMV